MKLLYHFIGRNCSNDDERYNFLLQILNDGFLKPNPKGENAYFDLGPLFEKISLGSRLPVSFIDRDNCDDDAFKRHMERYSFFGIGFEKQFILEEGGNPVFYCFDTTSISCSLRGHFHNIIRHFEKDKELVKERLDQNEIISDEIELYNILKFVIPFNLNKSNKEKFVYHEREWRVIATDGDVWDFVKGPFIMDIKNVIKEILVPRSHYERLERDIKCTNYFKNYVTNMPKLSIAEEIGKGHISESIRMRIQNNPTSQF